MTPKGNPCHALQIEALKWQLIEESEGIQPALALQIGEKISIEAENAGHDFVPIIGSVKGCLRQGVMGLAHSDDVILPFEEVFTVPLVFCTESVWTPHGLHRLFGLSADSTRTLLGIFFGRTSCQF